VSILLQSTASSETNVVAIVVAAGIALIVGGFVLIAMDERRVEPRYTDATAFPLRMYLLIGLCQCLAVGCWADHARPSLGHHACAFTIESGEHGLASGKIALQLAGHGERHRRVIYK
jgi:hypothetical protein